jgi:hypothetical protein
MIKIFPYLLVVLLFSSGCAIVSNTDQLSVLGGYSREKDSQQRLVQSINDHYDALTKVIAQGQINEYKDEASFVHSFGDPISKKDMKDGTERWLYRYAILRFAKDKVYVYFSPNGNVFKWEKVPCSLSF